MSNWLKEAHPEIKEVREIAPEHIQEWINDRSEHWTQKTLENHLCHIKYLEEQAQRAFGKDNVKFYKTDFERPKTKESERDKAMSDKDFLRLRETFKDSRTFAKDAIEITYRSGLRVNEVAHLKREDINLENKTIYVSREGAKNGRSRIVPIRDKDLQYYKDLLERNQQEGYLTNIKADSINKAIRRAMKDTRDEKGETLDHKYKQTEHAIRKLYATNRMREERGLEPLTDKKEEMKCWDKVSKELGHGEGRINLYKVYCKG